MNEYPTRSYPYRPLPESPTGGLGAGSGPAGGPPELKARLVGVDPDAGRALTSAEFARLSDPFALLVLKRDKFPKTLQDLLGILDADPAGLPAQRVFIVSEWGQIPLTGATHQFRRGLRYAIARGKAGAPGADLLISAPPPSDSADVFLQVAGWDSVNEVFHYYERGEGGATWFWEGDSWHALTAPTRGKGPFDSHVNGAPVMKELKEPWLHWSSNAQEIVRENFPPAHPVQRASETTLFNTRQSAHLLQLQIVQPGVRRWTTARMRRVLAEPQGITDPEALVRQLLTATTVNIASAKERSRSTETEIRIPETMFADVDTLVDFLLPDTAIETVTIPRPIYEQAVAAQQLALRDTRQGFAQPGDTFFAWPAPERGFEDIVVVQALVQRSVLTTQFTTALLRNPQKVLELYRTHIDPNIQQSELFTAGGQYIRRNPRNNSTTRGAMHLVQTNNTLGAEIEIAGAATIVRLKPDGSVMTDQRELIECGDYGAKERNSDPFIGARVNFNARNKADITIADPVGIYFSELDTQGWEAPDGIDCQTFWRYTRGTPVRPVRAVLEVPSGKPYVLGDVTIDGRSIQFGGQVADRIQMGIQAVACRIGQSTAQPVQGCVGQAGMTGPGVAAGADQIVLPSRRES